MEAAARTRGRPRLHAVGTTYHDQRVQQDEAAALAEDARTAAGLLGILAAALEDFVRGLDGEAIVTPRGDAIAALGELAAGLVKARLSGAPEVQRMAARLVWPQAGTCRRDATGLREMAERIGRRE